MFKIKYNKGDLAYYNTGNGEILVIITKIKYHGKPNDDTRKITYFIKDYLFRGITWANVVKEYELYGDPENLRLLYND